MQADGTITNNKPDSIVRDNEKGTCVNRCCKFNKQKCDKKRGKEDPRVLKRYIRSTAHAQFKNISDTSNSRDNCNHLKTTQTIAEQHTGRA